MINADNKNGETSLQVRQRVVAAREKQIQRMGKINADLTGKEIDKVCKISDPEKELLENAMEKLGFSARAYHRILKIARTIADLAASDDIQVEHLTEALSYRRGSVA